MQEHLNVQEATVLVHNMQQNNPQPHTVKKQQTHKQKARKIQTGAAHETWSVGDKALHSKWGTGTIVKVQGEAEDMELDIAFPAPVGIKRLLAKFAPITKQ